MNQLSLNPKYSSLFSSIPDFEKQLSHLLWKQAQNYTQMQSSSLPVDIIKELFLSVDYVLHHSSALPQYHELEEYYLSGLTSIEQKIRYTKQLWEFLCLHPLPAENRSYTDTLKSIGLFWQRYQYHFFAHQIPCEIDYQPCHPVSENLLGIDYLKSYLETLCVEQEFISRFDAKLCTSVLEHSCSDYKELLINLYQPIATNAIGLSLIGEDFYLLNVSPQHLSKIEEQFLTRNHTESLLILKKAAQKIAHTLHLGSDFSVNYLEQTACDLYPRIKVSLPHKNLKNIFLEINQI